MDIRQAINDRRSIRSLPGACDAGDAPRGPDAGNESRIRRQCAALEFAVAAGDVLEAIRQDNIAFYDQDRPTDVPDIMVDGIYRERSREIGKALFAAIELSGATEHAETNGDSGGSASSMHPRSSS